MVVVSTSVVTEPLVPQVPALNYETPAESVKRRKQKVGAVSLQASEVMQSRKRPKGIIVSPPVSVTKTGPVDLRSETPTQLDKNSKRKQTVDVPHATRPVVVPPAQEVVNSNVKLQNQLL